MQIELTLNDGLGDSILLPKGLALDDLDAGQEIPGAIILGRDGRINFESMQRLEPVTLRASGLVECVDKDDADRQAAILRSKLLGRQVMWLKRHELADRFIKVKCTRINHNYLRGHYLGRVFRLSITFQADDPYWYSTDYVQINEDVVFTPPVTMLQIENAGGACTHPVIWIPGKTSGGKHTRNPKIANYTTGQTLQYTGELKAGELLILNCEKKTARQIANNVINTGNVASATVNTVGLAESATSEPDAYKDMVIKIILGTGAGQYRKIMGYNGVTKVAVLYQDWEPVPDTTSVYEIYDAGWAEGYFLYEAQYSGEQHGANAINKINDGYLIDGFSLAPGINIIEVEDEHQLLSVKMLFRKRWT
jgi:hypothetical protein